MQLSKGERFAFPTQPLLNDSLIGVRDCCPSQGAACKARLENLRHPVRHVRLQACIETRSFMDAKARQFFEFVQEGGGETFFKNGGAAACDGRQGGRKESRLAI